MQSNAGTGYQLYPTWIFFFLKLKQTKLQIGCDSNGLQFETHVTESGNC